MSQTSNNISKFVVGEIIRLIDSTKVYPMFYIGILTENNIGQKFVHVLSPSSADIAMKCWETKKIVPLNWIKEHVEDGDVEILAEEVPPIFPESLSGYPIIRTSDIDRFLSGMLLNRVMIPIDVSVRFRILALQG